MSTAKSIKALWPLYEPKLFTVLQRGYGAADLHRDLVAALVQVIERCARHGTKVILSGFREQPLSILAQMGVAEDRDNLRFARDFAEALKLAASSDENPPR